MRRASGVLLAALTLATSGCGRPTTLVGPLGEIAGTAGDCLRADGHARFVLGDDVLQNRGTGPVTLDAVELENDHNVHLTDARVAPIHRAGPKGLMGSTYADPAHFDDQQHGAWQSGVPAVDAVIRPGAHDDRNLIVVVALDDDQRTGSTGVWVAYHDAQGSYAWHDRMSYQVLVDSPCRQQ